MGSSRRLAAVGELRCEKSLTWPARLCKQRNYSTNKNKKNDPDRLERNKFCKFCRKHTPHKEVEVNVVGA